MLVRPAAVSGLALTAAMIAVVPTVVIPREVAVAPPVVHVEELHLAGIGQDIYQAITDVVQQVVGGASYLINFTPIVGGLIAAQININYFQGIQPVIEATVNYAASIVQNPLDFIDNTRNYGTTLYDIGYNYVSAQLQFIGLAPLPPLPPIPGGAASARTPRGAAAAAQESSPVDVRAAAPDAVTPASAPAVERVSQPAGVDPSTARSGAGAESGEGAVGRRVAALEEGATTNAGGTGQRPARSVRGDADGAARATRAAVRSTD